MAIPVLAGLPWLAAVIAGIVSSVFSYAAKFISKRVAVVLVAIGLIAASTTAFIALVNSLVSSLSVVVPPFLSLAVSLVVPDNTAACVSVLISARIARWVYEWNVRVIQYKLL